MAIIGSIRPADQGESPDELRNRALIIRGHATMLWRDEAVPQWLQLADELEARAAALVGRADGVL